MLTNAALRAAIRALPTHAFRKTFFRAMLYQYRNDPLGKGRPIHAQRFNVEDGARMLYVSEHSTTCPHEIRSFGFPDTAFVVFPLRCILHAVVDLRAPNVLKQLHMTTKEMLHNFRMSPSPTPTQLLGEAIAAYGHIDGMLYVSPAVTNATNLVIVEHSLEILGGSIEVHEENVYDCLP